MVSTCIHHRWVTKENVKYTHNGIPFSLSKERNSILPFMTVEMELEYTLLSELRQAYEDRYTRPYLPVGTKTIKLLETEGQLQGLGRCWPKTTESQTGFEANSNYCSVWWTQLKVHCVFRNCWRNFKYCYYRQESLSEVMNVLISLISLSPPPQAFPRSHWVAQVGLECVIILPQFPECWNYRHVLFYLTYEVAFYCVYVCRI